MTPPEDRVWKRLTLTEDGCWQFAGLNIRGYGQISGPKRTMLLTHRLVWQFFNGPIPEGLVLDHLCGNRACCNPWHLDAVTRKVNNYRASTPPTINAGKLHCPQGHPYDEANTMRRRRGGRECLECNRQRCRAAYRKAHAHAATLTGEVTA